MELITKTEKFLIDKDDNNKRYSEGDAVRITYYDDSDEIEHTGKFIILEFGTMSQFGSLGRYESVKLKDIKYRNEKYTGEIEILITDITNIKSIELV